MDSTANPTKLLARYGDSWAKDGSNSVFFFRWYLLIVALLKTVEGVYPAARKLYEVASSERRLRSL